MASISAYIHSQKYDYGKSVNRNMLIFTNELENYIFVIQENLFKKITHAFLFAASMASSTHGLSNFCQEIVWTAER